MCCSILRKFLASVIQPVTTEALKLIFSLLLSAPLEYSLWCFMSTLKIWPVITRVICMTYSFMRLQIYAICQQSAHHEVNVSCIGLVMIIAWMVFAYTILFLDLLTVVLFLFLQLSRFIWLSRYSITFIENIAASLLSGTALLSCMRGVRK